MLGSQALELVIGLSLVFFVLALVTSTVVEVISRLASKRANELEKVIQAMAACPSGLYGTSVFAALTSAAGKRLHRGPV